MLAWTTDYLSTFCLSPDNITLIRSFLCFYGNDTLLLLLSLPSCCLQQAIIVLSFTLSFYSLTWPLSLCLLRVLYRYSISPPGRRRWMSMRPEVLCTLHCTVKASSRDQVWAALMKLHHHRLRREKMSTMNTISCIQEWLMTHVRSHHGSCSLFLFFSSYSLSLNRSSSALMEKII